VFKCTMILLEQIKSAQISNFISFKSLLILVICILNCAITLSILFILISIIIWFLEAWTYDQLREGGATFETWFFLKNFDFAKTLWLDLREMSGKILEMLFVGVLLNCTNIHCLKDLLSLITVSLFQPDS